MMALFELTDKETKSEKLLRLQDGEPMIFGPTDNKGIYLDGTNPKVVDIGKKYSVDDIFYTMKKMSLLQICFQILQQMLYFRNQ